MIGSSLVPVCVRTDEEAGGIDCMGTEDVDGAEEPASCFVSVSEVEARGWVVAIQDVLARSVGLQACGTHSG